MTKSLADLFLNIPDNIIVGLDTDGHVTLANITACKMLGYASDEALLGKAWFKVFIPASDREEMHGYFKDFLSGRLDRYAHHTNDVLSDDGTLKSIEWDNTCIKDDHGDIIGVISSGKEITKERDIELTLREQRELLRNVIDENPDPVIVKDKDAKFILVNKACASLYGSTPEEMIGKDDGDYIPDQEQAEFFRRNVQEIMRKGEVEIVYEDSIDVNSGKTRHYKSVKKPYKNTKGGSEILVIAHDITDEIDIQEALKQSEALLKSTEELSKTGGWEWDIEKQTMYWTEGTYRIHEMEPEDHVLGSPEHIRQGLECYDEADRQTILDAFKQCAEKGEAYDMEFPFTTVKGRRSWIRTVAQPVMRQDKVLKVIGNIIDITERKEAEEALFQSHRRAQRLMDSLPGMAYRCKNDREWTMQFLSEGCLELTGHPAEDMLDNRVLSYAQLIHPDDQERVWDVIQTSLKDNRHFEIEYRITTADGVEKWVWEHGVAIDSDDTQQIVIEGVVLDISARKQAESALLLSNEKFETIFDKTPNIVSLTRLDDGKIYDVNNTFEKVMGHKKAEVIGKTTEELDIWADIDQREIFKEKLRKEGCVEAEIFSVKGKDDEILKFEVYANMITIDDREYILASSNNITKQYTAERALQESEGRFKALMEQSPFAIEIFDLEGLQTQVNHAHHILWGVPASRTLNRYNVLNSIEIRETGLLKYIKKAYAGEAAHPPIYRFDPSGETEAGMGRSRWVNTTIYPLKDNDGEVQDIVFIHEDVTDRQEALALVEQKKKELETIIQEAPNPIMLHDEDGKILMVNKIWEQLSGYSAKEIDTIERWTQKAHPDEASLVQDHIATLFTRKIKTEGGEYPIITKRGDRLTWKFSSATLGVMNDKRTVISAAMDITELKRKDEMLIAQSRSAAMGEMISMIAHQWRQPLAVISMDANNMLADIDLEDFDEIKAKAYAYDVLKRTQELSRTIDDFRNFFKPDKAIVNVKLQDVLEKTYAIVKDSLRNHHIAYRTSFASMSELNAYPRELMQVFVNIITNAKDALLVDHSHDASIEVKVFDDGDHVITDICDNGSGIDPEILNKIFEPYFTTKEKQTGTGLGLYMSKMIIDKHLGGKIEVFNQDRGACFRVKLKKQSSGTIS